MKLGDIIGAADLEAQISSFISDTEESHLPFVHSCTVSLSESPLPWLLAHDVYPKFYWRSLARDEEIAAVGSTDWEDPKKAQNSAQESTSIAERFTSFADAHPAREQLLLVGGQRFSLHNERTSRIDSHWSAFPDQTFFIPRLAISRTGVQGKWFVARDLPRQERASSLAQDILNEDISFPLPVEDHVFRPRILSRTDQPDENEWEGIMADALAEIRLGTFEKVVLARRVDLALRELPDLLQLMTQLAQRATFETLFLYSPQPGHTFLGLSPENLVEVRKNEVRSDALGGSTWDRGPSPQKLGATRENTNKLSREHGFVLADLQEKYQTLTANSYVEQPETVMSLPTISHLHSSVCGERPSHIPPLAYPGALHPTPAICGTPRASAEQFIHEHEPFDRGWYGGFLGWATPDTAHFALGIRSLLLRESTVSLFSGVGVVEGSTAEDELSELEQKIAPAFKFFS